jgi:hypothetical protein
MGRVVLIYSEQDLILQRDFTLQRDFGYYNETLPLRGFELGLAN